MTTFADRLNPPIEPKPARFNRPEPWDYYRRTYIATPFAGASHVSPDVRRRYTLSALADSIGRKEAPIAPHLLYPLVLDDADPEQREIAMLMGRAHLEGCLTLAVYVDPVSLHI